MWFIHWHPANSTSLRWNGLKLLLRVREIFWSEPCEWIAAVFHLNLWCNLEKHARKLSFNFCTLLFNLFPAFWLDLLILFHGFVGFALSANLIHWPWEATILCFQALFRRQACNVALFLQPRGLWPYLACYAHHPWTGDPCVDAHIWLATGANLDDFRWWWDLAGVLPGKGK